MKLRELHENPEILHEGTKADRAYYIPYEKEAGDRTILLSGTWKFRWFPYFEAVPEAFKEGILEDADQIPVPSCVNMLGYEKNCYANVRLVIPFDPPYVPKENPCGAYVKEFEIENPEEEYDLNFEGVDSCFYVWVNGNYAGYSQVSHATAEFDITPFIKKGKNILSVLVLKWCDGTYFEDQDKLRMTGIFRDVYLLRRPKNHLRDFYAKTKLFEHGNKGAELLLEAWYQNGSIDTEYELFDPAGEAAAKGRLFDGKAEIFVEKPYLWNAEEPYLYTLKLTAGGECIKQKIGFREAYIENSVFYVNGKPVRIKGVNRHDSNAYTGYTISRSQLKDDLVLMKEHNINAIRTSHYPNAPWAYEMYAEMGFYIIDEADLETHNTEMLIGGGRITTGNPYEHEIVKHKSFGLLMNDPAYEKEVTDRIEKLVSRDKNQSCVVIWSLGNESGYGVNLEKAAAWIKEQDPDFLVHYESSIYEMPGHVNDLSNIDFYSRMYMGTIDCEKYLEQKGKKPLLQCEYSHAMGNGPGDLEDYYKVMLKHENYTGGLVWEWCDHAVYDGVSEDGREKFLYGGDFGEEYSEENFCVDGLIYPDRKPHTGLREYRNVLRPLRAELCGEMIRITNMLDFKNSSEEVSIHYRLEWDGKKKEEGEIEAFILPRESLLVKMPCSVEAPDDVTVSVILEYRKKEEGGYPEKGCFLGRDQVCLRKKKAEINTDSSENDKLAVLETERMIKVSNDVIAIEFDKWHGIVTQIWKNGIPYFKKHMEYHIYRAPADNDRNIKDQWMKAGYNRIRTRVKEYGVRERNGKVQISFEVGIGALYVQNAVSVKTEFLVFPDGRLKISMDAKRAEAFPYLPRFGMRMWLFKELSQVEYTGYGPYESYVDKHQASYYGTFASSVKDLHEDYIRPQENGSHMGCNQVRLFGEGKSLMAEGKDFSFHASYYAEEEIIRARHNFDLKEADELEFCIDAAMSGMGSGSCGPQLLEKYQVPEQVSLDVTVSFGK